MDTSPNAINLWFWLTCGVVLLLLMVSAFFSGTETALTAASRSKLRSMADRGDRGAAQALEIKEDQEKFIGAILMGNNIANVVATSLATAALTKIFGVNGVALASLVMTVLILIFAEVLPKTYAITRAASASAVSAKFVIWVIRILSPFVAFVRVVVRSTLRLFGVQTDPDTDVLSAREEILGAITLGHSEGAVEKEDRDRLLGALDLHDRTVEEIMRHRREVEMIDAEKAPGDIITQALASPHTRLPVYRGDDENILGVVHAKDLLREVDRLIRGASGDIARLSDLDILKIAMKPYFVPETTPLDEQMRQFLKRRTHFALVVDEYGALRGLITLEDILEEIVGEIRDEFDIVEKDQTLARAENGDFIVEGAMTIRDLNRLTDWGLPDDEANTVAGLVIHEAQMIPNEGQAFSFHGFRFEVAAKKDNRIVRLHIRKL